MDEVKKDPSAVTVERLLEQMSKGKIPWRKNWEQDPMGGLPFNYGSGRTYTGVNVMHLMMAQMANGYTSSGWLTFNAAQTLGGHVRKGEKCERVRFMFDVKDKDGNPVLDRDGEQMKRPMIYQLFNTDQCEGLDVRPAIECPPVSWRHEQCERLIAASNIPVHYGGNAAYYRQSTDHIQMPLREQFPTASGFYAVLLHELGHASGHPSRLNREMSGKFGTPSYAKEELRAEFFSMIVADRLGVSMDENYDPNNHVAYLQSWMEVIKNDPQELFRAASEAEKIAKFYKIDEYARENIIDEKRPPEEREKKPSFNPKRIKSKVRTKPKTRSKQQQQQVAM